MSTFKHKATK